MKGEAVIDPTGTYRYTLTRAWDGAVAGHAVAGHVLWVLLNPSTATAEVDDPTIRRCIGFSRRWGYSGLVVCNLFALRCTDPRLLYEHADPVGPENDTHILAEATRAKLVVCAWGAHGALRDRGKKVCAMLRAKSAISTPLIFKMTKGGQPVHPLYQRNDARLSVWLGWP